MGKLRSFKWNPNNHTNNYRLTDYWFPFHSWHKFTNSILWWNLYYSFIKDTGNLADYYVWSGGDYPTPTSLSNLSVPYNSSKEYIILNDSSLKIYFDGSEWRWINIITTQSSENETYITHLKIYNNSGYTITVRLIDPPSNFIDCIVPSNNHIQNVSLTKETNSNNGIKVQINTSNEAIIFIDDVIFNKR